MANTPYAFDVQDEKYSKSVSKNRRLSMAQHSRSDGMYIWELQSPESTLHCEKNDIFENLNLYWANVCDTEEVISVTCTE